MKKFIVVFSQKRNKAPGHDGNTLEHIQLFYTETGATIQRIIQGCMQFNYFLVQWKKVEVIILPKQGKNDYSDPSVFRPICLLPALGKMLEGVILNRILKLSDLSNWISSSQHGFRKGKSTITALEDLTKQINIGFQKKRYTSCVLLDIKGAFDNAWHPSIITNLKKKNCPDYLIKWIFNFLNQRTATLRLFDQKLETCIKIGCPQGSPLSPFLWNLLWSPHPRICG